MSVGGTVIEVLETEQSFWVNTIDGKEECAIYVVKNENSEKIKIGDSLWWQGGCAYWTAKPSGEEDIKIERRGYSGAPRPLKFKHRTKRGDGL
jgi:hypothetical protein